MAFSYIIYGIDITDYMDVEKERVTSFYSEKAKVKNLNFELVFGSGKKLRFILGKTLLTSGKEDPSLFGLSDLELNITDQDIYTFASENDLKIDHLKLRYGLYTACY